MVAIGIDQPGALLREVVRLHARAQRDRVACCGTTVAQCHLLTELLRSGPATVTALARRLGVHKGWASRGAAGLARAGLLARGAGADGREVVVGLNPAGRRRAEALERTLDGHAGRVLDLVPAAERPGVLRALTALAAALQAMPPDRAGDASPEADAPTPRPRRRAAGARPRSSP